MVTHAIRLIWSRWSRTSSSHYTWRASTSGEAFLDQATPCASLADTFAGIFAGGMAPTMFALFLKNHAGNAFWIASYIADACAITLVSLAMGRAVVDDVDVAARG